LTECGRKVFMNAGSGWKVYISSSGRPGMVGSESQYIDRKWSESANIDQKWTESSAEVVGESYYRPKVMLYAYSE